MAEMQRYQRSVQIQPTRMGNEQAQGFQTLANRLQSFANQQHQIADKDAERAGTLAGQSAASGKRSGVDFQDTGTIRGRAFNKGAVLAHAAQIQIDVRTDVSNFARENQYDVTGFDTKVEGMKKGLLAEVDPRLRPHAEKEINDYASIARSKIQDNVYTKETNENLATINALTNGISEDILIAARDLGLNNSKLQEELDQEDVSGLAGVGASAAINDSLAMLEKKRTQLTALYNEGVENNILKKSAVQTQLDKLDEQIDGQIVKGHFYGLIENEDIESAQKQLDAFRKGTNKELGENISLLPDTKDSIISDVQTKINKIKTAQKTELGERTSDAKTNLDAFNSTINQGHLLNEGVLNLAIENAEGTEHHKELLGIKLFQKMYKPFIVQTVEGQKYTLAQAKAKTNMSVTEAKVWERLEKVHKNIIEEVSSGDGLVLFSQQGNTALPVLDFSLLSLTKKVNGKEVDKSKEEIESSKFDLLQRFEQNVAMAKKASIHYNVKVPPITQAQAKALNYQLKESSREEVVSMLLVITEGFGDHTPDVMEAIFENDTTAWAAIGGQVVTAKRYEGLNNKATTFFRSLATDMLKGIDAMKDHSNLIPKDFNKKVNEAIGQAYADFPEHKQTIINGIRALYAQRSIENNIYGDSATTYETDDKILNQALRDATGGYVDMEAQGTNFLRDRRYTIELPRNRQGKVQSASQVDAWLDNLTADDIDKMGGVRDFPSEEVVKLINDNFIKLVSYGDGLYAVRTGRDESAIMLNPYTDEPFLLDYHIGKHYQDFSWRDVETDESKRSNENLTKQVGRRTQQKKKKGSK